jgi:hypothetical protein
LQQVTGGSRKSGEIARGGDEELRVPVNKILQTRGQFCLSRPAAKAAVGGATAAHWTLAWAC